MQDGLLKKIATGAIVFFVVVAGLWFAWNLTTKPGDQTVDTAKVVPIEITDIDHIKGSPDKRVVLVEFSDFECPACKTYAPLVDQVMKQYDKDVTLVYKYFALPQHKNSKNAAYAAEAAGKQDKFFEMHDILFDKQDEWSVNDNPKKLFEQYAKDLKLDMKKYAVDVNSVDTKKRIERDISAGTQVGVNSTPSFYLNGVKLKNPTSFDEFSGLMINALKENAKKIQESTPSAQVTGAVTKGVAVTPRVTGSGRSN